ncbi:hypothetical protein CDO73_08480 [Saccharibacillus sp. O23]|uniref:hypothetical protein n=1 Tax=Saccharibacillus sp. O23 TaxID=2009338 RepID=UPI000B4E8257|nr:hypothetical protein [Saccharibacillus sp. O23]OWR31162.1 hypothetical protein CDO73_08480 [Saccharibacillus sp. O23]
MTRSFKNALITIRNFLTLRNLLALLCAAALIAVIVKGFRIEDKIRQVDTADAYYANHERLSAEAAYANALANTVIRYREDHVRERLAQLAPLTRMREELLKSKSELLAALENQDFDAYLAAYELYEPFERLSLEGEYAAEYKQLDARYQMDGIVADGFADFRSGFEQALAGNLDSGDYGDESAKPNLLRIPAVFFAPEQPSARNGASAPSGSSSLSESEAETLKTEQLNALFEDYDRRKLKKLAAAGRYTDMLREASRTLNDYGQSGFEAPWVRLQAEETVDLVLRSDLEAKSYADFAAHARSFADFVSQNGLSSDLTAWIDSRVGELNRRAGALVADGRFEEGIALYRALDGYADTETHVAQAEDAWTEADPLRILRSADDSHTYKFAISGKNRFGADLYVAALDENGTLYFGTKSESGTSVSRDAAQLAGETVRSLKLDESLSTDSTPVLVAEAESTVRKAVYTALIPQEGGSFAQMFKIEADGYRIEDGGMTLRAENPSDAEQEGQTAVYTRYAGSDVFAFSAFEGGYADIGDASPALYPEQPVRATMTVLQSASGSTLARTGDGELMLLTGDFEFAPGTYLVTGTFQGRYEQIEDPDAEPPEPPQADDPAASDTETGAPNADSDSPPSVSPETNDSAAGNPEDSAGDPSDLPSTTEPETAPEAEELPEAEPPAQPILRSVPVFEVEAIEPA